MEDQLAELVARFGSDDSNANSTKCKFTDDHLSWLEEQGFYQHLTNWAVYKKVMRGRSMKKYCEEVIAPLFMAEFYPDIDWSLLTEDDGYALSDFLYVRGRLLPLLLLLMSSVPLQYLYNNGRNARRNKPKDQEWTPPPAPASKTAKEIYLTAADVKKEVQRRRNEMFESKWAAYLEENPIKHKDPKVEQTSIAVARRAFWDRYQMGWWGVAAAAVWKEVPQATQDEYAVKAEEINMTEEAAGVLHTIKLVYIEIVW